MRSRKLAATFLAATLPALALAGEAYRVDTVHSTVIFRVKHMGTSFAYGRFNVLEGTFDLDPADPGKSAIDFTVKAESIDTGNPKRDGHLKSPDFFNVRQYPKISFKSRSVTSAGKDTFDVNGDLTLHGVTKPVTVKVERVGGGKGMRGESLAGIEATFAIKRSDFGMKGMQGAIGDDVRVIVSAEGNHR